MKPLRFALLAAAALLAAGSLHAQPRTVDEFFGSPANRQRVANASTVEACVLRYTPKKPADEKGAATEERYDEGPFVKVPSTTTEELRKLVLDRASYSLASGDGLVLGKLCYPVYHVRLRFRDGAKTVAVDFCFSCGIARTLANGREVERADFDPAYARLREIFVGLFPDDAGLKKTKAKP